MSPFGLKKGQDLENWPAHPHQEFPGVPPGGEGLNIKEPKNGNIIDYHFTWYK